MDSFQEQIDLNVGLSPQNESASESSHDESGESIVEEVGSSVSSPVLDDDQPLFGDELIELSEDFKPYGIIAKRLFSCLGPRRDHCRLVSIHMNNLHSPSGRVKTRAFQIFAEAAVQRHGCHGTLKYAWCAVGRKEISEIMKYGFGEARNDGFYGRGLYLTPDNAPLECLEESVGKGDELRFLLLCRVILGRSEIVPPGSNQSSPSSTEFDSGVDNLLSPKKYVVWSTHMNTHVLPMFAVCLKVNPTNLKVSSRCSRRPSSPWIPFPILIAMVSKFLDPRSMRVIRKHYMDQRDGKISRSELIRRLRRITGDEILVNIIKTFQCTAIEKRNRMRIGVGTM